MTSRRSISNEQLAAATARVTQINRSLSDVAGVGPALTPLEQKVASLQWLKGCLLHADHTEKSTLRNLQDPFRAVVTGVRAHSSGDVVVTIDDTHKFPANIRFPFDAATRQLQTGRGASEKYYITVTVQQLMAAELSKPVNDDPFDIFARPIHEFFDDESSTMTPESNPYADEDTQAIPDEKKGGNDAAAVAHVKRYATAITSIREDSALFPPLDIVRFASAFDKILSDEYKGLDEAHKARLQRELTETQPGMDNFMATGQFRTHQPRPAAAHLTAEHLRRVFLHQTDYRPVEWA